MTESVSSTWDHISKLLQHGKLDEAHLAFLASGDEVDKGKYLLVRHNRIMKRIHTIEKAIDGAQYDDASFYVKDLSEVLLPDELELFQTWWSPLRHSILRRLIREGIIRSLQDGDSGGAQRAYATVRSLDEECNFERLLQGLQPLVEALCATEERRITSSNDLAKRIAATSPVEELTEESPEWFFESANTEASEQLLEIKRADLSEEYDSAYEDAFPPEQEEAEIDHQSQVQSSMYPVRPRDKAQISQFAQEIGIEYLVHFTRVVNLRSILEHGIKPRQDLKRESLQFEPNDMKRLDGKTWCTCVSISIPNYKMLTKYHVHGTHDFVILLLNPQILWKQRCYFFRANAASSLTRDKDLAQHSFPEAFVEMFEESDRFSLRTDMHRARYETTDPQAEVLVARTIPVDEILYILVEDSIMRQRIMKIDPGVPVRVAPDMFAYPAKHMSLDALRRESDVGREELQQNLRERRADIEGPF